ncbi:MAG: hypothetical protein ACO1O6_03130 [Bacteroidota bacterium]
MLRFTFLFCCTLFVFGSKAQNSYEFKSAMPPEGEIVKTVDPSLYGAYKNEETGTEFVLNAEGISMVTIINSYITKEQVRETSKYQVRNGYLFGVKDNDSIPCIFEDDKYFFGIRQKITLNDPNHKAIIKKISPQAYVLNFLETKGYSPSMITFKGSSLVIRHFTYPGESASVFEDINKQEKSKEAGYDLVLLNPNQKEWNKLDKSLIFDTDIVFLKI